ncbi:MAG: hypothetical protein ABIG89_02395, partial [Candidatus Woesearchaeota archaeon]
INKINKINKKRYMMNKLRFVLIVLSIILVLNNCVHALDITVKANEIIEIDDDKLSFTSMSTKKGFNHDELMIKSTKFGIDYVSLNNKKLLGNYNIHYIGKGLIEREEAGEEILKGYYYNYNISIDVKKSVISASKNLIGNNNVSLGDKMEFNVVITNSEDDFTYVEYIEYLPYYLSLDGDIKIVRDDDEIPYIYGNEGMIHWQGKVDGDSTIKLKYVLVPNRWKNDLNINTNKAKISYGNDKEETKELDSVSLTLKPLVEVELELWNESDNNKFNNYNYDIFSNITIKGNFNDRYIKIKSLKLKFSDNIDITHIPDSIDNFDKSSKLSKTDKYYIWSGSIIPKTAKVFEFKGKAKKIEGSDVEAVIEWEYDKGIVSGIEKYNKKIAYPKLESIDRKNDTAIDTTAKSKENISSKNNNNNNNMKNNESSMMENKEQASEEQVFGNKEYEKQQVSGQASGEKASGEKASRTMTERIIQFVKGNMTLLYMILGFIIIFELVHIIRLNDE